MSFFPGDTIKPSASREREVTRLLEAARGERASFGVNGRYKMEPGHVLVRNDTGADLEFGKAALIETNGWFENDVIPRKDPEYRTGFYKAISLRPMVSLMSPRVERMGLAVEPIKDGKFGVMAIAGLAVATYGMSSGYIAPLTNNIASTMFGFAKVVANPNRFGYHEVWDLSCHNPYCPYELTARGSTSFTADIVLTPFAGGRYSSAIYDPYNIAKWQVVGDTGIVYWAADRWIIVTPWCPGSDE